MNDRKQQANSFLNSITEKELQDYINEHKLINKKYKELLERIRINKPKSHFDKILEENNKDMNTAFNNYINLGRAWVMAFVLECFYEDKYKLKDLQIYLKTMMDADEKLKEYVYECMKDF